MSRHILSRLTRITLLTPGEPPVEGDLLPLADEFRARSFLKRFLLDSYDMMVLRGLYAETDDSGSLVHVSDHDIIAALARRISAGQLRVVREPESVFGGERTERAEPEEPVLVGPPVTETKHWIKLKVVDDETGEPIPGVVLHVREPSGLERDYATRPDGMIEVDEIDPGTCDVSCYVERARMEKTFTFVSMGEAKTTPTPEPEAIPKAESTQSGDGSSDDASGPAGDPSSDAGMDLEEEPLGGPGSRILEVEEHKVRTHESLDSLAQANGMTWEDLAEFNWDTSVPKRINEHLRDEVGCTKKTRDGHNYMFDDTDEPGIVYIPKPWARGGLATEQTHVFRVRPAAPFHVILENESELRIPEIEYEATFADGRKLRGKLGRTGVALIKNPPPGIVEIEFLDFDDIESKSLAACVRKAFDERKPDEVYRALEHSPTLLKKVDQAYAKYYNDHTGKGFVEDTYQEITDPDALMAVEGLLARGGLPTHGDVQYVEWNPEDDFEDEEEPSDGS